MMKMPRKKWIKILLLALGASILIVVILAITLYKMVTYVPAGYQPEPVDLTRQEQINHYADKKMEELYNSLQIPEPFTIRFEQKPLNELLMLAQKQRWFGKNVEFKHLQQPQISFTKGRVSLMTRVQRGKRTALLTISIKPWLTEEDQMCITLDQVKLGALPIPQSLLKPYFQRGLARLESIRKTKAQTQGHSRDQARSNWLGETLEKCQPGLQELIDTQKVLTHAGFKTDDTWVEIQEIQLEDGKLEIKLAPQPMQNNGN
jgi:hypothetical protein